MEPVVTAAPASLEGARQGERLVALVPIAVFSAAAFAGFAGDAAELTVPEVSVPQAGSGFEPASAPSVPVERVTEASRGGERAARPAQARSVSETATPMGTASQAPDPLTDPSHAAPSDEPTPIASETQKLASTPAPTPTPTATEEPEPLLTEAEATAQCLESGISALDVAALDDCVADLLG